MQQRICHYFPQAYTVLLGTIDDFLHSRVANSSCRIVDNAPESLLVIVVDGKPEVCNNILYLFSLVERQPTVYPVWYGVFTQLLLKRAALGIGAVQYGKITVVAIVLSAYLLYVLTDDYGFLLVTVSCFVDNLFAFVVMAVNILVYLSLVMLYQAVGCFYNALSAAVVLFELEQTALWKTLLEVKDIVDVCSAESINALGIVANDTKPMMVLHELQHNSLLSIIGILVFIDENKLEPFCIFASDVVVFAEKYVGVHQQIVEVHGIGLTQPLVVSFIDCPDCRHLAVAVTFLIGLYQFVIRSCFKVVLCHRNPVVDCCWLVYLVVKAEALYYLFQQRARVSLVIYRELRVITYA